MAKLKQGELSFAQKQKLVVDNISVFDRYTIDRMYETVLTKRLGDEIGFHPDASFFTANNRNIFDKSMSLSWNKSRYKTFMKMNNLTEKDLIKVSVGMRIFGEGGYTSKVKDSQYSYTTSLKEYEWSSLSELLYRIRHGIWTKEGLGLDETYTKQSDIVKPFWKGHDSFMFFDFKIRRYKNGKLDIKGSDEDMEALDYVEDLIKRYRTYGTNKIIHPDSNKNEN